MCGEENFGLIKVLKEHAKSNPFLMQLGKHYKLDEWVRIRPRLYPKHWADLMEAWIGAVIRHLRDALNQLDTSKDKLGLPDTIVEKTAYIYRKAQQRGLVRGRTISAMIDAAMYIACRELGIPKTLKEIAGANNIKRKTLARSYRLLISELDIKIPIVDPTKCITKVANKANLNEKTKRKAIDIMYHLNRKEIPAGKDPMGIAATVLYIACLNTGEKRTQTDIAQAAGITEMTLRNRYKDIKRRELDLIPSNPA